MINEQQRQYLNSMLKNNTEIIQVGDVKVRIENQFRLSKNQILKEIKRLCSDTINEIDSLDDEHICMCLSEALRLAVYHQIKTYDMNEFNSLGK